MACALLKLAFAHILTCYDLFLPDSSSRSLTVSLSFEEFYDPNFGLKVGLQVRK
jgi:hypothetical protein